MRVRNVAEIKVKYVMLGQKHRSPLQEAFQPFQSGSERSGPVQEHDGAMGIADSHLIKDESRCGGERVSYPPPQWALWQLICYRQSKHSPHASLRYDFDDRTWFIHDPRDDLEIRLDAGFAYLSADEIVALRQWLETAEAALRKPYERVMEDR